MEIYELKDSEFMTARDKALTLKNWGRFLRNGLQVKDFTNRLYDHLIQHCSFIAHYDRLGFYDVYFSTGEGIAEFLSQFDSRGECFSVEYGHRGPAWYTNNYNDINAAMIDVATAHIPRLLKEANRAQRAADLADLAEAARLRAKHVM